MIERLKFRGWHKESKCWIIAYQPHGIATLFRYADDGTVDPATVGEWTGEQVETGIYDEPKVDLYEDDLIYCLWKNKYHEGQIVWAYGGFCVQFKEECIPLSEIMEECTPLLLGNIHDKEAQDG